MAGNNGIKEIKTRITLDNSTKFKAELNAVNSQLKVFAAQVKTTAASFDKVSATAKNYTQLNAALSKQIEQQKVKVNALKTAVSDQSKILEQAKTRANALSKEFGENSRQAQNAQKSVAGHEKQLQSYQTQLANAETQLAKLNTQYRNNENEAKKLSSSTNMLSSVMSKLPPSAQALIKIGGDGLGAAIASVKAMSSAVDVLNNSLKAIGTASIKALTEEIKLSETAFISYEKAVNKSLMTVTKATTETAGSFEFEMSKVQAYSNLDKASDDFKQLQEAAISVGSATSKTATEAAQALGFMSLAGWDTERKLSSLLDMVHASEAGNMDLALTSQLVTQSMASLSLTSDRFKEYLDKITAAQNNSNTSMQQMMEVYVTAGGMLTSLGVPLTESATLIGRLADQGIYGSEAGHKLNSILVNLIGANKKAKTAMTELGVSAWDSNGEFIGLTKTLELLRDALSGATQEQMVNFEAQIGGKLQLNTLQKLLAGIDERYTELYDIIENSDGILEQTTETMLDNFKGSVTILQSALEGLNISVGQSLFLPSFTEFAEEVTVIVNNLKTAFESGGADFYIDKYFDYLEGSLTKKIKRIIPDLDEFYSKYREFFDKMSETVLDIGINIAPDINDSFIPTITESFSRVAMTVAERADEIIPIMIDSGSQLISGVVLGMSGALYNVSAQLPSIVDETIGGLSETFAYGVTNFAGDNLNIFSNILKAIGTALENDEFNANISKMFSDLITIISNTAPKIIESGANIIKSLIKGFAKELPKASDLIQTTITDVIDSLSDVINTISQNSSTFINFAVGIIGAIGSALFSNLPQLLDDVQKIIGELGQALVDNTPAILEALVELATDLVEFVADNIGWIADLALTLVETLAIELTKPDILQRLIESVDKIAIELLNQVGKHLPQITGSLGVILIDVIDLLTSPDFLDLLVTDIYKMADALIDGLIEGWNASDQMVFDTISESFGEWVATTDWSKFGEQILSSIFGIEWSNDEFWGNFGENWRIGMGFSEIKNDVVDEAQDAFEINSPSKVMRDEVGVYLVPGIVEGIDETKGELQKSVDDVVNSMSSDSTNSLGLDLGDEYYISFSTNLDEIQNQINEMRDNQEQFNYWSEVSTDDINNMTTHRSGVSNSDAMTLEALSRIENILNKATITINTQNYLYPNGQELASSVSEALLFNNAVTGGR